ncbi:MAG: HAD family hydrolase [Gemmatimonadetes bacterium]|nr:HAD family hydrolase [Gemmatimonadota bacterium]MYH18091.1 HAD family hydrolase [Gemmatimonadota bacterium]MYK98898.1 HAD family hydrolase [Gemmatimonadota bacterium]
MTANLNITAISFDVDQTLIDTDQVIMRSMESVRDELIRRVPGERTRYLTVEQMWSIRDREEKDFVGNVRDFDEIRRRSFFRILDHVGYTGPDLSSRLNEVYLEHRYNDIVPYEDVMPMLDALEPRFKLGLLSNGNNYPEYFGLDGRFEFAVYAQDIGIEKPDPRTFQIAAERAGCSLGQLLHVGDSLESDVEGAQEVGVCAVWLNRDEESNETGIQPDHEIKSLTELTAVLGTG